MVSRSGGPGPGFVPSGGANDNRLDQAREQQLRQLQEQQITHSRQDSERLVEHITQRLQQRNAGLRVSGPQPGEPGRPARGNAPDGPVPRATPPARGNAEAPPANAPTSSSTPAEAAPANVDLGRLVADFQRQNGLPVTGKLDAGTVSTLRESGVIERAPSTTTQGRAPEPASPRAAPRPADTAAARQARSAVEQQVRARVDGAGPKSEPQPREAGAPLDRIADPTRMLASLFAAGFVGQKGSLEEGLKSFQATFGLPLTGKPDAETLKALAEHGVVEADVPKKAQSEKPVEPKQTVRRALNETTSKNQADRDVARDPLRPQAPTQKPTTTADVAARAPVSAQSADAVAEQARLDTVMAQQQAVERGVQEGTGDPAADKGHGEVEGQGAGLRGKGGVTGGGGVEGEGEAAAALEGPEGEESVTGNSKAGDDDFTDDARGNANMKAVGDEDGEVLPGYWQVPPLSEQVRTALNAIARDDDGNGPVTYTWDVTFLRPGVYGPGQPADELWHVAVNRATAFDPVWQTAADAIASRMLYAEPDAQPPTLDDFILALRRARVR